MRQAIDIVILDRNITVLIAGDMRIGATERKENQEMNKMCGRTGQDIIDSLNEELERERIKAEGKKMPPREEVIDNITSWRFER